MAAPYRTKTDDERFAENIGERHPCGCLMWLGATDRDGYGVFSWYLDDGRRFTGRAHRYAFLRKHGYLPKQVRHTCDTPGCVADEHHLPGDNDLNMQDRAERNRTAANERHGSAVLSNEQACSIRFEYTTTNVTKADLARKHGLSVYVVGNLLRGQTYKGAGGPIEGIDYAVNA